jgi:high-affinity nickel-transport protein
MELAQTVQVTASAGGAALLGTALALGLRHGIDWDHLAAIGDITGTTIGQRAPKRPASSVQAAGAAIFGGFAAGAVQRRALWLSFLYALGHGLVVVTLGMGALLFGAILPEWVDPVMERLVGVTLLVLGAWVAYSLVRAWRGGGELRLQSRWMLLFAGVRHAWHAIQVRAHGHSHAGPGGRSSHVHRVDQYGVKTAFGTGLVHGIGAETGTQVLLIAAVGGAATQGLGLGMLLAFVAGLLVSNTAVAYLTCAGFLSAQRARVVYLAAGVLAAIFSLWVGSFALLGISDHLPDLQAVLADLLGPAPA